MHQALPKFAATTLTPWYEALIYCDTYISTFPTLRSDTGSVHRVIYIPFIILFYIFAVVFVGANHLLLFTEPT